MPPRKASAAVSDAAGIVRDLVHQFDDPLHFLRELVQNSIDAGSNRIDVTLDFPKGEQTGTAVVSVEDDGEGMDEAVIDDYLLVLFRSSKEEDFTKIGKFGIGFVSVFAIKPELVRVLTAKAGQSWRLDFPSYKKWLKYKLSEPREGTRVEVHKKMSRAQFGALAADALKTLKYWCKHSETRIFFRTLADGLEPEPLPVNEPFDLPGGADFRYEEEGTEIVLAFADDAAPFCGYYNRGITLKEDEARVVPGLRYKVKSRYLEHTLTRDNVMRDANFEKVMRLLERLASESLPPRARGELEACAAAIAREAAAGRTPPAGLTEDWVRRKRYLQWLFSGVVSRWRNSDWAVFPSLSGRALTLKQVQRAVETDGRLYADSVMSPVVEAVLKEGHEVLVEGPWTADLALWTAALFRGARSRVRPSERWARPVPREDDALDPGARAYLERLRELDRASRAKYRGIGAADFGYPGSAVAGRLFLVQGAPGELTDLEASHPSTLTRWLGGRRWASLNAAHPAFLRLAELHRTRPGLAAYLLLKMLHLHDGAAPPQAASKSANLSEELEGRLLQRALALDEAS